MKKRLTRPHLVATRSTPTCAALLGVLALSAPGAALQAGSPQLADGSIVDAIESELDTARAVSVNDIDVVSTDGVVTLTGTVDHHMAKQRAVRIARMVRGVRSVVDRLHVAPTTRTDAAIEGSVEAALMLDPATSSWQIDAMVDDGTVTLTGEVDSWTESTLATKIAGSVDGVRAVKSDLRVETDATRTDEEIQSEIAERLEWDARVDDHLIDVAVTDGRARLTGAVGSAYERSLARADAWVAGVREVEDDLDVRWWARDDMLREGWRSVTDEALEGAVEDAFLYDPRVVSFQPEVRVEDGTVTLRGTVDNLKAKQAAAEDARNTYGVIRVRNLLKVRTAEPISDAQIAENVRATLRNDLLVDADDVTVTVDSGEVHLYGTADSYFERAQARDAAARVQGVEAVHDRMTVAYVTAVAPPYVETWDPVLYDYDFDYETTRQLPDSEIAEAIESQLFWSPFVDADEVTVEVVDGVAILTGTVDSWSERRAAAENAFEGGAYRVRNRLEIDLGSS